MTDYAEYLKSPEWARIRNEVCSQAEWCCQLCGVHSSKAVLEVHHRSYKRAGKPGEMRDCVALCADCHSRFHEASGATARVTPAEMRATASAAHGIG